MASLAAEKTIDGRGRITLGPEFANQHVLVRRKASGTIELIPMEMVPAREAWLHKNPKAILAVLKGLEQAKAGELVAGPDLAAALELAEEIKDD